MKCGVRDLTVAEHSARVQPSEQASVVTIVLNWNGWLDTVECLESLLRCQYPNQRIIVCDNASQDGSLTHLREWARAKAIDYVAYDSIREAFAADFADERRPLLIFIQTGSNLGYGAGNNVGIRYALERLDPDYVWILNNDTIVDASALHRLLQHAHRHDDSGIVGSKLLQYHAPARIQALGGGMFYPAFARDTQIGRGRSDQGFSETPLELDHVVGASMLVRAEAMRDVGLLDESYFLYREETDWCIRMRHGGWRLSYCDDSVVWHKEGHANGFKTLLHDYYAVRNMLHLVQKFYPRSLATALLTSFCFVMLPKLARLQFERASIAQRAFADFLRGVKGKSTVDPDDLVKQRLSPR